MHRGDHILTKTRKHFPKKALGVVWDKKLVQRLQKTRKEMKVGAGKNWIKLRKELEV